VKTEQFGKGIVAFSWQHQGNFLAACGSNRRVYIYDRQGKLYHQFSLEAVGQVSSMDWDCEGEILAVLQEDNGAVALWDLNTKKVSNLETNMKQVTFLKWSLIGPELAIGSIKGSLLLYNRKTTRTIPVKGKHTKRITTGCWNRQNDLALGSEDLQLTISNAQGDTIDQKPLKYEPSQLAFSATKELSDQKDTTLSCNAGGKVLWLFDYAVKDSRPVELMFNTKYGKVQSYRWFGDGYIMIGFQSGYVVILSTHIEEIGSEINSTKYHNELHNIQYSPKLLKGASIGDNCVKMFDMTDLARLDSSMCETVEIDNEYGTLRNIHWTDDGQILTVSSTNGNLYTFLTSIPALNACYESQVLYLVSLREMQIKDIANDRVAAKFTIDIEPSFVSLGPQHAAVGMNNRVQYYRIAGDQVSFVGEKEYLGTVENVYLGYEYVAVFSSGKLTLQNIEKPEDESKMKEKFFPEKDDGSVITSVAMTPDFLIFSTSRGNIFYFSFDDWSFVNEYRFDVGVNSVFPNPLGTRLVFIDETHAAYVYNPVDDAVIGIEKFAGSADRIMWDVADPNIFVASDAKTFTTYVYSPVTRWGPKVHAVNYAA
jgi:WD repeat-containing protein 19